MGLRSSRELAARRRQGHGTRTAAASGDLPDSVGALEKAVPTEIIAFYTAVIAACEAVLKDEPDRTFATFRAGLYVIALLLTGVVWARMHAPVVGGSRQALRSAEWWTAVLAFAAWGLVLPGSFLYVTLDRNALAVTVATITAAATLVMAVVLAPALAGPVERPRSSGPSLLPGLTGQDTWEGEDAE